MANPHKKWPENVQGDFFVDNACISCGFCWREAPDIFASHPIDTYAYVQRQPQDEAEKIAVQIILDTCPVQAIGKVLTAGAEYSRN